MGDTGNENSGPPRYEHVPRCLYDAVRRHHLRTARLPEEIETRHRHAAAGYRTHPRPARRRRTVAQGKTELKWLRRKEAEYPPRGAAATSLPTLACPTPNRNS